MDGIDGMGDRERGWYLGHNSNRRFLALQEGSCMLSCIIHTHYYIPGKLHDTRL